MARRYLIGEEAPGLWVISFEKVTIGWFTTEAAAQKAAIEAAHCAPIGTADVAVLQEDAAAQVIWTRGKDPYPPAG